MELRWIQWVLGGLMFVLSVETSAAQAWPPWADELFGRPSYGGSRDLPAERRSGHLEQNLATQERPQKGPDIRDGGPRPVIAAIAPPTVSFPNSYAVNSIVIDIGARKLYYVLPDNMAYAYPIGVGREGFGWTGAEQISRKQAWPDWHPPAEMRERDPKLPEKMIGGVKNPLGAMALYLGNTLYRIHGTNDRKSIGRAESSGCFRMLNSGVLHLASLVEIGTPVTVVDALSTMQVSRASTASSQSETNRQPAQPAGPSVITQSMTLPQLAPDYRTLRHQTLKAQ